MSVDALNLDGLGVLVTRPAHQAQPLCDLLRAHNGRPLLFPALMITPIANILPAQSLLSQVWDVVIYTSTNAVTFAASLSTSKARTTATSIIAIGNATANILQTVYGAIDILLPTPQNSEGILALPLLARPAGQRILIVRGEGGRSLLSETLLARGALVSIAEVYQRGLPTTDVGPLLQRWEQDVQTVVVTSGESLDNLIQLLGQDGRTKLLATPMIVISERLRLIAHNLGVAQVICARGADDVAILVALQDVATFHH